MNTRLPIRVVGILIKDNKLLLIKRNKQNQEYFIFPGGGLEKKDESKFEGLEREMKEETSLEIEIERLVYVHDYGSSKQFYYLCKYLNGKAKLASNSIEKKKMDKGKEFWEPTWVDINNLKNVLVYPLEIRDWLIEDLKSSFPESPRKAKLKIEDLRQTL